VADELGLLLNERQKINKGNVKSILGLNPSPKYTHIATSRDLDNKNSVEPKKRKRNSKISEEPETKKRKIIKQKKLIEDDSESNDSKSLDGLESNNSRSWNIKFTKDIQKQIIKFREDFYYNNHPDQELTNRRNLNEIEFSKIDKNKDMDQYLKIKLRYYKLENLKIVCPIWINYSKISDIIIMILKRVYEDGHDFDIMKNFESEWQEKIVDNLIW
jgi:hypothetical protein